MEKVEIRRIFRCGDSLVVSIPKDYVDKHNLTDDDFVQVHNIDDFLIIKPLNLMPTLEELEQSFIDEEEEKREALKTLPKPTQEDILRAKKRLRKLTK